MDSNKCPVCGAPLNGEKCEYCDYQMPKVEKKQVVVEKQPVVVEKVVYQQAPIQNQHNAYQEPCSTKDKMVALILCIFLGYFGVHHFYVGKIGTGILYIFTAGLFGIGWIVDIVKIASGSFKDNKGLKLK